MRTSWSCPPIRDVALCSNAHHGHTHPSVVSHFALAHVTVVPTHQRCRFLLLRFSWSCPPIRDVAFRSCARHGHAHPSEVSHSAHPHVMIIRTHQTCRIVFNMRTSWSCPPINDVAFRSCAFHGHVHPSTMSYSAHVHVMVMPTHQRCRILLMRTS